MGTKADATCRRAIGRELPALGANKYIEEKFYRIFQQGVSQKERERVGSKPDRKRK